jgi:hypothetical protein
LACLPAGRLAASLSCIKLDKIIKFVAGVKPLAL